MGDLDYFVEQIDSHEEYTVYQIRIYLLNKLSQIEQECCANEAFSGRLYWLKVQTVNNRDLVCATVALSFGVINGVLVREASVRSSRS